MLKSFRLSSACILSIAYFNCNFYLIIAFTLSKHLIFSVIYPGCNNSCIQPRICERYEPCKMVKKTPCKFTCKAVFFLLFYRATALQRGKSFPSCAWRMPLLHRDFSLAFALDFLDLTTFLRQILGKIYLSDFLTTFYDNGLWFIPQQVRLLAGSF